MPWWAWLVLYATLVWLQTSLSAFFGLFRAAPDIFLAATITMGLLRGPVAGAATGLLLGLSGDLVSGRLIGLGAVALAVPGIIAGLIARRVYRENLIVLAGLAAALAALSSAAYVAGASLLGVRLGFVRGMLVIGLPVALYTAVLVPVLYLVSQRKLGPGAGNPGG